MGILVVVLLGGLLTAAPALAQTPAKPAPAKAAAKAPPPHGRTDSRGTSPAYDVRAEVTIAGVVGDVHESKVRSDDPGLHLIVQTATEAVEVHTCPVRFMKDLDFGVEKGEAVTIIGSRPGGIGNVLAREIKKGQTSLSCRDKAGAPVWR